MTGRLNSALGALALMCVPSAAQAAKLVTFTFTAKGTGEWTGNNGATTIFSRPVSGATLFFTVSIDDNANGGFGAGGGMSYGVGATTDGVRFNSVAGAGYGGLTSSGLACFTNSAATLSYGVMPVDAGCGMVTFRDQYRDSYIEFTGTIDGLTVTEGGTGVGVSITPFIPEPKTWALMLAGFAMVGYALRHRRPHVTFAI